MRILAVDSTAVSASCAILDSGKITAEYFINTALTHSQTLLPMIDGMLKSCSLSANDIDLFAVNNGPGSFTGVRIGVAAVKGLAFAAQKPCVAVPTLEAIAEGMRSPVGDYIICAAMDARCSQVYNALFESTDGELRRLSEDRAITLEDLEKELKNAKKPVFAVGDGAILCYNYCLKAGTEINLPDPDRIYQRASATAIVAQRLFDNGKAVSADELEISYLRLPQATRELLKRQKG